MSTRDFTANVISASKVVPDGNFKDSKASGIWDINEALDLIKGGNWPNAANLSPDTFVDGLFQCHLYEGNGGTQTITNNINLSGKGGLVWIKNRDAADAHNLVDTVRGATKVSPITPALGEVTDDDNVTGFTTTGFTIGDDVKVNTNNESYASWTFRKQAKFFDIVQYSGNGSARTIAHNLGSVPGMIIVIRTDDADDAYVYHRGMHSSAPEEYYIKLSTDGARADSSSYWNDTAPTSSVFSVGNANGVNNASGEYIAYLFAHNNDDGGFGEPGNQDIIKCGSYSGGGNYFADEQDIGFEPQWLLIKTTTGTKNWVMFDNMRGLSADGSNDSWIYVNTTAADNSNGSLIELKPTGFKPNGSSFTGRTGKEFIYVAIRRGGMQTPTAASDVFAVTTRSSSDGEGKYTSGFPVDFSLANNYDASGNTFAGTRLTNAHLQTNDDVVEGSSATDYEWDHNDGVSIGASGAFFGGSTNNINYMWKRARGYFDVVAYTGTGSARTVAHNLGVVPEMMWIKNRDAAENWPVYHKGLDGGTNPETHYIRLNQNNAEADSADWWNDTAPTSSVFTVGTQGQVNTNNQKYIAYLFATAAGVSKLGSYTGNGSSQNIDCGFSGGTGARFVLIKNVDATGSWVIFDTTRGLVAGNDNYLRLDVTNAQGGGYDFIDPLESGFTINQTGGVVLNESGETYIFYAIA